MSDNWNQPPENNQSRRPKGQFNRPFGLPHSNNQNPPFNNPGGPASMPPQSGHAAPANNQNQSLQSNQSRPPSAGPGQPNQQQRPPTRGLLGGAAGRRPQIDNMLNQVRGFSNKMAAIAGHTVQPPAPPMDIYRPQAVNTPQTVRPAERNSLRRSSRMHQINRQIRQRRLQRNKGARNTIALVLIIFVASIVVASSSGGAYGYSYYLQQQPRVQQYANEQLPQITRIFDRNGVLLYEAYDPNSTIGNGGRRIPVTFQQIPTVMQEAMVAIEDKTFWTNDGIDLGAILRAGASSYGGGSTLTQQLIKNLSGDNQDSYIRKLNEAAMAIGMTREYTKAQILDMYFNVAPFGAQEAGVEIAAQDYFDLKPICPQDQVCTPAISQIEYNQTTKKNDPILGLARASLLAAIPNSPVSFDPALGAANKAGALGRQKLVLQTMMQQGMTLDGQLITPAMATQAEAMTSQMTFTVPSSVKNAPGFVDYIINQVETALGNGDPNAGVEAFLTGGYNIRTTIDLNLDNYAQDAITRHLYQPELQKGPTYACGQEVTLSNPVNGTYCNGTAMPSNVQNGAVVVQDVKNGEILAMVGSANYDENTPTVDGEDDSITSPRSPGSTFKLFDYATAFEMGWNPGITLADTMTAFPNGAQAGAAVPTSETNAVANASNYPGIYLPSDYGATWWNFLESITWATANSMNVPAIRAMQFASPDAVKATAERLGVTFIPGQSFGYAAAIGADGVTPLQMVNAYATFGNAGVRVPPQTILDITNNYGEDLYHYNENNPPGIQVVSPQVAYEMTGVLSNEPARDFEFSGDHDLSFSDVDASCADNATCSDELAAKTGTTDNFTDNWTIGYTANVAVAVWVGNDNNAPLVNSIGITGAAPIFHSVMERTLGWCNYSESTLDNPSDALAMPDQVKCGPSDGSSGYEYNFPFSANPQLTFTEPSGVTQGVPTGLPVANAAISSYSKLPANGAVAPDWMLLGE
jgi:membrane peptidoglycan carboxypeptidase